MVSAIHLEWDDDEGDVVHEDIPVTIPFLDVDTDERDVLELLARGDVPFGRLVALEDSRPNAMTDFFAIVFYDDDNDLDDDGEPIPGTSSLERYNALSVDPKRRVPGKVLSKLFSGLYGEYGSRTGLRGGPARPTSRREPSRAQRRQTGRTSTARRGARASISAAPEPE